MELSGPWIVVLMLVILILQSFNVFSFTNTCYIIPDTSEIPAVCPNTSDPCVTITQFAASPTTYLHDIAYADLVFLPGRHSLKLILTLEDFQNVVVLSILGRRSLIGVTIDGSGFARLDISEIAELRIENIKFIGFFTARFKAITDTVLINNCSFISGNGTALELEYNGDVTVSNSDFISNVGSFREHFQTAITNKLYSAGGALFLLSNNNVIVKNCTFVNNSADVGGVMYSASTLYYSGDRVVISITNCSFFENMLHFSTEESTNYNDGVVLYCADTIVCSLLITKSIFMRNINIHGFALFAVSSSNIVIKYSIFAENHAAAVNADHYSDVILQNNKFSQNTNTYRCGGLLLLSSSSLTISGCNFIQNEHLSPTDEGGGVVCASNSHIVTSCSFFSRNYVNSSGGVYYLDDHSSLNSSDSLYDSNIAGVYGGVIYAESSSNVAVYNDTFLNNNAVISGGVFSFSYNSADLILFHNLFRENSANISGGVLHILDTAYCNSFMHNNSFEYNFAGIGGVFEAYGASVFVNSCNFTFNSAKESGGVGALYGSRLQVLQSRFIANSANSSGVFFMYSIQRNSFINQSLFLLNKAEESGAVIYGSSSTITFSGLECVNNSALLGVLYFQACDYLYVEYAYFAFNRGSFFTFNSKVFIEGDIEFSSNLKANNNADFQEGGAITFIQSELTLNSANAFLQNNNAIQGGAVMLSETKLHILNSLVSISDNNATLSGGGMYCFQSEVINHGRIILSTNRATKGGAMHMIGTRIKISFGGFLPPSSLHITDNIAKEGGGIYFEGNSKLYVSKHAPLSSKSAVSWRSKFINNSADYGGAIFVADGTDSGTCSSMSSESVQSTVVECTIQVLTLYEFEGEGFSPYWNFVFLDNVAHYSGSGIYGGLLDRCKASFYAEVREVYKQSSTSEKDFLGVLYLKNISNIHDDMISSEPVKVCFCINGTQDCSITNYTESVMKGKRLSIQIVAVDQLECPVTAMIRAYLSSDLSGLGEGQLTQQVSNNCSDISFEISSMSDSEVLTLYAEGPCKDIGISKQQVVINFLPCKCPIGFKEDNRIYTRCECVCDDVISSLQSSCDVESASIIRQSNFWLSYLDEQNGYIVHAECPFDYCYSPTLPVSINLNLPHGEDAQCRNNRIGKLCGACQPGYSTVLGSTKCLQCSNNWIALILVFALAGVALVTFILYFNLTVAIGTLNGLTFYANIVMANREIYIKNSGFLSVFISWLNLDLGIESCLYDGMDNYTKVWFRFLFPLYIIALVIIIIVVSERWECLQNC